MNRRGFLQSCLALAAAPAIVRADSLMRIVPRDAGIITFDGCDQWMAVPPVPQEPFTIYGVERNATWVWYRPDGIVFNTDGKIIEWKDANGGPSMFPGPRPLASSSRP